MGWTPPSKFVVIITLIFMVFGIFIFMDLYMGLWDTFLPELLLGEFNVWDLIIVILFFLTWFLFYLGVKLKGF
ncbi:MAG: hypothetical protein ACFFHD_08795 [Promethearchaeota archaeon]